MSLFQYNNFLKIIIKNIKYRLADELLKDFFKVIEPKRLIILSFFKRQEKNQGSLLIQPIPLHVNRLRVRGFNQAKIIADAFQKLIDVPLVELLVRKKETFSQAQLKKGEERFNNIRGAFIVTHKAKVKRKSFILIDDVMTSGATIREAAKTLKLNGANRVFALTLAKG
jgi:ComF family protein